MDQNLKKKSVKSVESILCGLHLCHMVGLSTSVARVEDSLDVEADSGIPINCKETCPKRKIIGATHTRVEDI